MNGFRAGPPVIRPLSATPAPLSLFSAMAVGPEAVLVVSRHAPGAWVIDVPSGHWAPCDLPEPMSIEVRLRTGQVLCSGSSGHWLFSDETRSWARVSSMPAVKQAVVCRFEDDVLLVGGFGDDARYSWRGDPLTGAWTPLAPMPLSRWGDTALVAPVGATDAWGPAGARVFVAGTNNKPSREQNERLDVYDPERDRWDALPCPEAGAVSRAGPGLPPWGKQRVDSIWGVVSHVVQYGDRLYCLVAERANHAEREGWSVHATPLHAVLDLTTLAWMAPLQTPSYALTGQFPGTAVGLGYLLSPSYGGLGLSDGHSWRQLPWPDGADGHPGATFLDDARVVVIGRTRSWIVQR
jgi:hypothetical protein